MTKERILVTGARGGLASDLSKQLCDDFEFIGIDPRLRSESHFFGDIIHAHYRSRKVDDLFRKYKFRAVFHLGRVPVGSEMKDSDRYSENVLGTQHLLNLCEQHNVPTAIALSTFHVYGAHPHNPIFLKESDPLRATQRIPQLSDALEFDHIAAQFGLSSKCKTILLRPTNVVGKNIFNTISNIFRLHRIPTPLGFDPLMQFVHQSDILRAFVAILNNPQSGIYNLAGPGTLPLSQVIALKGAQKIPVPDPLLKIIINTIPLRSLKIPDYMIDFFKYSSIIDSSEFSQKYDFNYSKTLIEAIADF